MAQEWRPNSDRPNFPDSGSATRRSTAKPTWSFHERYASDSEFKRQIDEARKRKREEGGLEKLSNSLMMAQGKRPKLY